MSQCLFTKRSTIKAPIKRVFKWHQQPGALQRLTPPWVKLKTIHVSNSLKENTHVSFKFKVGPLWISWRLTRKDFINNQQFCDEQVKGPFKTWFHRHVFKQNNRKATVLEDRIEYQLPFSPVLDYCLSPYINGKLQRIFHYRHDVLKRDLVTNNQGVDVKPMRILIAGASGLIGSALKNFLTTQGHHVVELSHAPRKGAYYWNPEDGNLDTKILEDVDAVVNLAGAPISKVWTKKNRDIIYKSRILSTKLLAEKIAKTKKPPRVLINASGINIYGVSRTERLHEGSKLGQDGFLTELCKDWEAATEPAKKAGTRVVLLRNGLVLSPAGGALGKMMPAFKFAMGGRLGSGHQAISWVTIDDVVDIIYFCILHPSIQGPVNTSAPHRITNFRFKQAIAKKINRPAWLPVPAFVLRLIFGQMAEETILSDLKVQPQKLLAEGFTFRYPRIEQALNHILE